MELTLDASNGISLEVNTDINQHMFKLCYQKIFRQAAKFK
jgi:hypothetical protein